jgi:hypothetical protein
MTLEKYFLFCPFKSRKKIEPSQVIFPLFFPIKVFRFTDFAQCPRQMMIL